MGERAWRRAGAGGLVVAALIAGATIASTGSVAGAATPQARATLVNQNGEIVGTVVFKGHGSHTDQIEVDIEAPSTLLPGSFHGLHVHTVGDCTAPFTSAGGHWNPTGATHGNHVGDLPSVLVTVNGETHATFESDRFDVGELLDENGSAVVLHAGPDNFNNVPSGYTPANAGVVTNTQNTGDAGGRYACGVVTPV